MCFSMLVNEKKNEKYLNNDLKYFNKTFNLTRLQCI